MNGKERVLKALRFEEVDRVPWVPFTGVHVAKLVGSDAEEMLKNGDILVNAVETAAKRYYADGVCSAFDLQAEAEVLGCGLHWSKNNPPAVTGHVLAQGKTLEDLPEFTKDKGRLPMFFDATKKLVERIGDEVAVFGLCCGPFTPLHARSAPPRLGLHHGYDEEARRSAQSPRLLRGNHAPHGRVVHGDRRARRSRRRPDDEPDSAEALRGLRFALRQARHRRGARQGRHRDPLLLRQRDEEHRAHDAEQARRGRLRRAGGPPVRQAPTSTTSPSRATSRSRRRCSSARRASASRTSRSASRSAASAATSSRRDATCPTTRRSTTSRPSASTPRPAKSPPTPPASCRLKKRCRTPKRPATSSKM